MYQEFTVTSVDINKATKHISVGFSNDVDPDSITPKTLYISTGDNGDVVKIKWSVDGYVLTIDVLDEIIPNIEYYLIITTDVINAMGDNLKNRLKQKFVYESTVRNRCKILSPVQNEEFDKNEVEFKLDEILNNDDSDFINSFYIQIAKDWLFENIITDPKLVNRDSVKLNINFNGQVYARARIQQDENNYGEWSESIVICINDNDKKYVVIDNDPIFYQDIEIISEPEQGETPKSFIIEFDTEIDERTIEDSILLLKRKI